MSLTFGKTRWKQFAAVLAPSIVAAAALGISMAKGVIAASFIVSGQKFKISADSMTGQDNTLFGTVDVTNNGARVPVIVSTFKFLTIHNLCQSVPFPLGPLGDYTLILTAGTGANPATARALLLDLVDFKTANATFHQIDTGIAAGALTRGIPGGAGSQRVDPNSFAQQAAFVTFIEPRIVAVATSAGMFNLPDSRLALRRGDHPCF